MMVVLVAAILAGIVFAADRADGTEGIGGVLRFREDGPGVTRTGLVILAGFAASTALLAGSWVDAGGQRRLPLANVVLVRLVLLLAVAFMFMFPDLSQFEAKSLTWQAIMYPTLGLAVPGTWLLRGRRPAYPLMWDVCLVFMLTVDIVSNDLHWYGTWAHWDDVVHFVNSVPIMVVVGTVFLVVARRGRIARGMGSALWFAFLVYLALHNAWEIEEHLVDRFLGTNLQPGGMEEATENNLVGGAGAVLGIDLLWYWQRRGWLDERVVAPLDRFVAGRA